MTVSGALARPMLAGIFIYGGLDAVRDPEGKAKMASDVAPKMAEALHLPTADTVTLVRINGGIQVVAGTMLALGKARRLSALALAASLIPTTYAGHRFWDELDEGRRAHQRIQFLKNLAMLGGLVLAAGDTGGRPSVGWRASRATKHALEATAAAGAAASAAAQGAAKVALGSTGHATSSVAGELAEHAQAAAKAARESDLSGRALKAGKKAAEKARSAEFTKATMKAVKKAGKKAAKKAAKKARKAQLGTRAIDAAAKAQRGAVKAQHAASVGAADVAAHARELAGDGWETAGDTWTSVGRTVEPLWENAASAAHHIGDRAKSALANIA